jgi:large subunit ribosomal protein L15
LVNNDPKRLDEVYIKMLGPGGDKLLSDEVKWLAVTHKSFDQGKRGFNDRLMYLGRRIISLQASLALLSGPQATIINPNQEDQYGRKPFTHPALNGLQGLTEGAKHDVLNKTRLSNLAKRYGIDLVTRWKPARTVELPNSGADAVYTASLYAIVGAIALERGGEVAIRVAKEKILNPLGLL